MIRVELKEKHNEMVVETYDVSYPFNLYKNGTKKIYWNLNSIEVKNIKNSFYLTIQKKIVTNGSSGESQKFLFQKRLLFYIDEKNPHISFNGMKKEIKNFLLTTKRYKRERSF